MIRKSTLGIGALAICLVVVVLAWERRLDSTDMRVYKEGFLNLWSEQSVRRLRIAGPGGEVLVERKEDHWQMVQPIDDEADPDKLVQLLRHLCQLPLVEQLTEKELAAEEFGFSKSNVIVLELRSAEGLVGKLALGREGPFERTAYVRVLEGEGMGRAGLVRMETRDWLATPLAQLRDRRLLRLAPGAVTQYRLKTAQGEIALRREEREPRWHLETPLQCRANDDIAYSLLEELSQMEAEEFRDDLALAGMASLDGQTAVFRLETGTGTPLEIMLRQEDDSDGAVHLLAKRSGRKALLRIRDDLVRRLPHNVNQLRYPYLAEFPLYAVARIHLRSRTDPDVVLFHSGAEWRQLYRSEQWPANTGRIEELLGALNAEPVLEYRSSSGAQSANYGLDQPLVTLSITTSRVDAEVLQAYREKKRQGGEAKVESPTPEVETRTLRFGRGEDAFLNANYEGEPYVYAVDPSFVSSHLPSHPLKWRGLRLLSIRPMEMREIAVAQTGGEDLLLKYDHLRNVWSGTLDGERIDEQINSHLAEGLAYHLGSLTAVDWLTDRRDALRSLQRPSCRVRIKTSPAGNAAEGAAPREIAVNLAPSVQNGRVQFYYGQFEGQPDVFLLTAETYARLVLPVLKQGL